jgi:hypothetical protein
LEIVGSKSSMFCNVLHRLDGFRDRALGRDGLRVGVLKSRVCGYGAGLLERGCEGSLRIGMQSKRVPTAIYTMKSAVQTSVIQDILCIGGIGDLVLCHPATLNTQFIVSLLQHRVISLDRAPNGDIIWEKEAALPAGNTIHHLRVTITFYDDF